MSYHFSHRHRPRHPNFIDVSRYYYMGLGPRSRSGKGTAGISTTANIATKVGRYGATEETFDFSAARYAAEVWTKPAKRLGGRITSI